MFLFIYFSFILLIKKTIYSTELALDNSRISIAPPKHFWTTTATALLSQPHIASSQARWSDAKSKMFKKESSFDEDEKNNNRKENKDNESESNKDESNQSGSDEGNQNWNQQCQNNNNNESNNTSINDNTSVNDNTSINDNTSVNAGACVTSPTVDRNADKSSDKSDENQNQQCQDDNDEETNNATTVNVGPCITSTDTTNADNANVISTHADDFGKIPEIFTIILLIFFWS